MIMEYSRPPITESIVEFRFNEAIPFESLEKRKDKFDEAYNSWNYSVRGKTVDLRELRVIVSFDDSGMLIITAIDLEV